jgi:hypothetical protein
MLFVVLFLAAAFLAGAFFLKRLLPRYATAIQRSWLVRVSLFAFCGLILLGLVLVPLPNKHRLVALVPIFFLVTAFIRVFKSGKRRMGVAEQPQPDLERMKRINHPR